MQQHEFEAAYKATIARKVGPKIHSISRGVDLNNRPWEYNTVLEKGEFLPGHSVLDAGALHTYFCLYLADLVDLVAATDSFYWATRSYNADQKMPTPDEWCRMMMDAEPKVIAEEADLQALKYSDGTFDRVTCVSTIEHVVNDVSAMREMLRVVRPGGLVLITTEYNESWSKPYSEEDGSYFRVYSRETIASLLDAAGVIAEEFELCVPDPVPAGRYTQAFLKIRKPG